MKLQYSLFSLLIAIYTNDSTAGNKVAEARLDEVAHIGRQVMPFNLEKTLHIFSKIETGGIQQVISKDPLNNHEINLIHEHLSKIAEDFKQGDFSDPEKIHGKDMPGLKALQSAKIGEISIQYRKLLNGAEILYVTENSDLVDAIHQWFDAQLSEHARHATMHHRINIEEKKN